MYFSKKRGEPLKAKIINILQSKSKYKANLRKLYKRVTQLCDILKDPKDRVVLIAKLQKASGKNPTHSIRLKQKAGNYTRYINPLWPRATLPFKKNKFNKPTGKGLLVILDYNATTGYYYIDAFRLISKDAELSVLSSSYLIKQNSKVS